MTSMVAKLAAPFIALGLLGEVAEAQSSNPADFYKNRQMRIIVSTGAGTVFDSYARLVARHMIDHIPGKPATMVPVNMPGAGGLKAANYMAKVAENDGATLSMTNQGIPLYQALELGPDFKGDVRDLNWIGNLSTSNQVLATWHTSPTKTLDDARKRVTIVGTSGAGSITTQLPTLYNNMLGTKFRIITGYLVGTDINLAMESGELEGRGSNTWASYVALNPDFIKGKKINLIIQVGLKKETLLPDVPLLRDLAKNPEEQVVYDFISKVAAISRPIVTAPNVPADRVQALRTAFSAMVKDGKFLKEAEKQRLDVSTMAGEELQQIVREIIEIPSGVRSKIKRAIQPDKIEARGK